MDAPDGCADLPTSGTGLMHALHVERPCAARRQTRRQFSEHADGDSWAVSAVRCAGAIPALRAEVPTRSSPSGLTAEAFHVEHVGRRSGADAALPRTRACRLARARDGEHQVEQAMRTGDGADGRIGASGCLPVLG